MATGICDSPRASLLFYNDGPRRLRYVCMVMVVLRANGTRHSYLLRAVCDLQFAVTEYSRTLAASPSIERTERAARGKLIHEGDIEHNAN